MEATPRIELGIKVLQTSALPLGYVALKGGAENEIRTRDPLLGKEVLYHWAISAIWCLSTESNCGHKDFQSFALPTELPRHDWRPGWDSNPRPPPWQGGILTNWTTGPMSVCLTVIYITIRLTFWQEVFWKNFRESFFSDEKGAFLQSRFVFEYHQKLHHSQTRIK